MAATLTDAQLRLNVAEELGITREGDGALDDGWDLWLARKSAEVREYLIAREMCWWSSDVIPASVSLGLSFMVAEAAKTKWAVEYDKGALGLTLIQEVAAKRPSGETVKAKFF